MRLETDGMLDVSVMLHMYIACERWEIGMAVLKYWKTWYCDPSGYCNDHACCNRV